jgi:intron-binding protein aquarius
LELSAYLEAYLWPFYDHATADKAHLLSLVLLIVQKLREGVSAWESLRTSVREGEGEATTAKFTGFFTRVLRLYLESPLLPSPTPNPSAASPKEKFLLLLFLIHAFQSLEEPMVRGVMLRLTSLSLWEALSEGRRKIELENFPPLRRHWLHLQEQKKRNEGVQENGEVGTGKEGSETPQAHGRKRKKEGDRKKTGEGEGADALSSFESTFLPEAIDEFLAVVEAIPAPPSEGLTPASGMPGSENGLAGTEHASTHVLTRFALRFLELLIDLLAQLPTRRFLKALLQDRHLSVRLSLSPFLALPPPATPPPHHRLASQLSDSLRFYLSFEINDHTGMPLTDNEMASLHFSRTHVLQRLAFKYFQNSLKDLAFASSAAVGDATVLASFLSRLSDEELVDVARKLRLVGRAEGGKEEGREGGRAFWTEVLVDWHAKRQNMIQEINERPLYADEQVLWDPNVVPTEGGTEDGAVVVVEGPLLALPKLNLQFLTFVDYLLRSYTLFRVESAYEIRADLMTTLRYLQPVRQEGPEGGVAFRGWARMGVPLRKGGKDGGRGVVITEVLKPNLGERIPAGVKAEITVDLREGGREGGREEWDLLREHDVVFLVRIENPQGGGASGAGRGGGRQGGRRNEEEEARVFCEEFGVKYVRGAEIWEVRDGAGNLMNDPSGRPGREAGRGGGPVGSLRTYKVLLDPAQYHADATREGGKGGGAATAAGVYEGMNVLIRRSAKENNFKAILATIRGLMTTAYVGNAVPAWLHDVFLGYGDPAQAHYKNLALEEQLLRRVDFGDTFLDWRHLQEAFPHHRVCLQSEGGKEGGRKVVGSEELEASPYPALTLDFNAEDTEIVARPYQAPNPGPYPQDHPAKNSVRFTPVQVEAIRSGMNPGLTMVVGPPGTGKTDVAVQIILNLYRLFPTQRFLVVTHSNAALNDIFEKLRGRAIDPRHMLRLGAGEKELNVEGRGQEGGYDFTKWGRVNYTLARRLELLGEVTRLARSLGVQEGEGGSGGGTEGNFTCETAEYFRLYQVQSRIEAFEAAIKEGGKDGGVVTTAFPFTAFFSTAPQPLFRSTTVSWADDLEVARGCFRHLDRLFEELADYRAFELLRHHGMRGDYLLTKQARIVAMTCTHAALTRGRLVELGFKFDGLVMEEAAQILEVETFIPMLLQEVDPIEGCRLKRVVLIGDHHQLPPIIQNQALQKYARLDQSLFARFVRLGVKTVQLDRQGRARPSLAALYAWRYKDLGNLPNVTSLPHYLLANPGMAHSFQCINVEDFRGQGESQPSPYFYQNLGEAEYCVALYMYLRLCGYPAEKISILTTYNGQKSLLEDVLRQRCGSQGGFYFGRPAAVETVDRYQGQQNDYVILSLVRTRNIGHIRDVRRLVVAMSRARLGLYAFCRQSLFESCHELTPAFSRLLSRPSVLELAMGERFDGWEEGREGVRKEGESPAPGQGYRVQGPEQLGSLCHQLLADYQHQQQLQWQYHQQQLINQQQKEEARLQEQERVAPALAPPQPLEEGEERE